MEVDGVMLSHKDVAEAVSFGVPDDMYGQEIHAAVVLKSDAQVSEKQLQEYVRSKLAKFKIPKKVLPPLTRFPWDMGPTRSRHFPSNCCLRSGLLEFCALSGD